MHLDPAMLNAVLNASAGHPEILMAYVGPGVGGGVVALALGFLLSIVLAVTAVFWYPLKRLIRKVRQLLSRGST
jgi:hypothetical protein